MFYVIFQDTNIFVSDFIYFGFAFGDNLLMGDDKTSLRIYVYTGLPTDGYVFHYITVISVYYIYV